MIAIVIMLITMLIIVFLILIMILMRIDDAEHEILMPKGPMCENVLQLLDMATPKPGFSNNPNKNELAGTGKLPTRCPDQHEDTAPFA